jgi:hypothetical protein
MSTGRLIAKFAGRKVAVDAAHLLFATTIGGWATWFCWEAWHASDSIENLILIVPVAGVAVLFYWFVAAGCFHSVDEAEEQNTSKPEPLGRGTSIKIAGSMALLGAFVVAGPLIGFDIASFGYVLAMMALLGERRILVLLLVPLVFCVAVIYFFNNLLSTPLPLFFWGHAS